MPTPAKLVSAVLFAALCWFVADSIVRYTLEEGVVVGPFREVLAAGGLVVGWRTIGTAATGPVGRGNTIPNVITAGVAAAFILMVLALLIHSFGVMIVESLNGSYNSVGKGASAWMGFLMNDARTIAHPVVLGLLFGGGALIGLVAGVVGQRTT
ncbi:TrgA family protein [Jannaschia marina]|uniref:TrgA family protein n=1 Tax=Jannaschia marina TaxID=2741674 RepID=UPI0015CC4308|nr:TrgA family protein [Jannaschia marina]